MLKTPLYVTSTDMLTERSVTFSSGRLFDPVIGSSSVPLVFTPVVFERHGLLDGGMLNSFPVEPFIGNCVYIMGSNVNKLREGRDHLKLDKVSVINQCFHMIVSQ